MDKDSDELFVTPSPFFNTREGFDFLLHYLASYPKDSLLISMEAAGHYHFALLKRILDDYSVTLINNPKTADLKRRIENSITKNYRLDTLTSCHVLMAPEHMKTYRITTVDTYALYEQKQLKGELNVYANRLQRCIDIVFPEFNSMFRPKYGHVYMNILKTIGFAETIANTDIRIIQRCFQTEDKGRRISLSAEKLKECARSSVGISSSAEVLKIRQLFERIELINTKISNINKK